MGMIINKQLKKFQVGFPTISDKYNVAGAILTGSNAVNFGDLVKLSTDKGYFEAITSTITLADLGGFVVGTNVKLALDYPATEGSVKVLPGEAFNLLVNGFIAIELDADAVEADITPNAQAYVILATGKITTSTNASAGTIVALPNVVFTGEVETVGTKIRAEIYVK